MKYIAKFEKVSFEQFKKDYIDTFLKVENNFEPSEELIAEIQRAYDTVTIPQRATKGSAGYDIRIPFDYSITPEETLKIPTGIRCKMNNEYVMLIFPRSSLGIKKNMYITNTIPVIDSDYSEADNEGHIFLCVKNGGEQMLDLKAGDAIVQAVFLPYGIADEEEVLTSRTGGIGSTDGK